jgi:hypothetical protein
LLAARLCALAAVLAACACAPTVPRRVVDRVRAAGVLFDVSYAPEDAEAARQVERSLGRAVHAAQRWGELSGPVLIAIHPTHRDLEAAARRDAAWLRAWARRASVDLQSPRTWSSGAASEAHVAELLSHELAHCVMFQMVNGDGRPRRAVPLWFGEGMASVTAGQAYGWVSAEAVRRLHLEGGPQGGPDPDLVYAAAARAFRFLLARFGDEPVRRILAGMSAGQDFAEAFRAATGSSVQQFEGELRESAVDSSQARAPPGPGARPAGHETGQSISAGDPQRKLDAARSPPSIGA